MKIDHFDVLLDRRIDEPYIGGQTVKGRIELHAASSVQCGSLSVRLTGVAATGWRNKNSDLAFESRHTVLDEHTELTRLLLDHCNDDFVLHEGAHCIPFEVKLPLDVVSSVERENYGHVRYTCTAVLELPEDNDSQLVAEKSMTVYSMLNLDAPYLREATKVDEEEQINGCCGRNAGSVTASISIAEVGLLPGETTQVTLTVENRTKRRRRLFSRSHDGKHECVLISLCQQLDFVATNRYETHLCDRKSVTIAVETHGTCKATPGGGPETKTIEFQVPAGLPPTSTHANRLVTISYFFKLDLDHFDVIVPVIVGSVKSPGPID